jgi:pimeloyl-ACP methyl ester carboxylesterase
METWRSHRDLAELLSDEFTVYLYDRRGHGLSSLPIPEFGLQTEVDDLTALARETDRPFVFGLSSGAIIALQTCLKKPGLFQKAILFEPPLLISRRESFHPLVDRFNRELDTGDLASAVITSMQITEMGPTLLRIAPRLLSRPVVSWALSRDDSTEKARPYEPVENPPATLKDLVPTMAFDFTIVKDTEGTLDSFAALTETKVLLLSGTASRPFLISSCEELIKVIPRSTHTRLQGLTHLGSGNRDIEGKPEAVAQEIKKFLVA